MFMSVDLPDPDAPITAVNSPGATESETPRNAWTSTEPMVYRFVTSSSRMRSMGFLQDPAEGRRGAAPPARSRGSSGVRDDGVPGSQLALYDLGQRAVGDLGADAHWRGLLALQHPDRPVVGAPPPPPPPPGGPLLGPAP